MNELAPTPSSSPSPWSRFDSLGALLLVLGHGLWAASLTRFAGFDAFYHIAQTRELWMRGWNAGIRSLPYTVLGSEGTDHHYLMHLLLLPVSGLEAGAALQVAVMLLAVLPSLAFLWWLRQAKVGLHWPFLLLLMGQVRSTSFG